MRYAWPLTIKTISGDGDNQFVVSKIVQGREQVNLLNPLEQAVWRIYAALKGSSHCIEVRSTAAFGTLLVILTDSQAISRNEDHFGSKLPGCNLQKP